MQRLLFAATAALCLAIPAQSADTVSPGFARTTQPNPVFGAATATPCER